MTLNERLRYFRKEVLGMNQRQFASALGMAQTSVSAFEADGGGVSDRVLKTICTMFNVREEWLRAGEGEMYSPEPVFSLDRFVAERGASELELAIVKAYFEPSSRPTSSWTPPPAAPCWSTSRPGWRPPSPMKTRRRPKPSSRTTCARKKRRPYRQLPLGTMETSAWPKLRRALPRPVGKTKRPRPAGCGLLA